MEQIYQSQFPILANELTGAAVARIFPDGIVPRMTFKKAVNNCLRKYATFKGRARRSEYWWFMLFILLVGFLPMLPIMVVGVLDDLAMINIESGLMPAMAILLILLAGLGLLALCALLVPSIAVQVRRLHDVGRSGWWCVASLIVGLLTFAVSYVIFGSHAMGVGEIEQFSQAFQVSTFAGISLLASEAANWSLTLIILVFSLYDSERAQNRYGLSPKYPGD